jgi:transmembrane sensor
VFFTDKALPAAVAEMNRYSAQQIIAGPELSEYRVNGMFRAGNQDGFVSALTSYFPIDAVTDQDGRIVLQRRPNTPVDH